MKFLTKDQLFSKDCDLRNSTHESIAALEKLKTDLYLIHDSEIHFTAYLSETSGQYYDITPYLFLNEHVKVSEYKGKYRLFDVRFWGFPNVNARKKSEVENMFKVPNHIGVFTSKKVSDWLEYWDVVIAELDRLNTEKQTEIDNFLESLKGLNVVWFTPNKAGKVYLNGLSFEFTIDKGFIDKKIELSFSGGHTVETFKKLADNKY